jgi:hypothetical protein
MPLHTVDGLGACTKGGGMPAYAAELVSRLLHTNAYAEGGGRSVGDRGCMSLYPQ